MNEGDEELTIFLLAVHHHEATIQTIVNLAAQAAALQESESTCSECGDYSVRPTDPVTSRLKVIQSGHASIFKSQTGFTASEFEAVCILVAPVLIRNARSTGLPRLNAGRPSKLDPRERVLSFVLNVKHNTGVRYESSAWNWSRSSLCDDVKWVADAITEGMKDEIQWPDEYRRAQLAQRLPEFPGCIGHVDGTLCRINRPSDIGPDHRRYFNGRKHIYCFNNTVVVDHDGLFIFVDPGYAGSFHDVNCLRHSILHNEWRERLTRSNLDDAGEYLLGDPGYVGVEMYILRRVHRRELPTDPNAAAVAEAFNRRHAAERVKVEWGIGGLKIRFRRLLTNCPSRRGSFAPVFTACCILTNFIHRNRMDFSIVSADNNVAESNFHEGQTASDIEWDD
jgi:DDE superfamily endonuclease